MSSGSTNSSQLLERELGTSNELDEDANNGGYLGIQVKKPYGSLDIEI